MNEVNSILPKLPHPSVQFIQNSTMAARARELDKSIAPVKDKLKAFIKARLDTVANAEKIASAHGALMDVLNAERQKLNVSFDDKLYCYFR